MHNERRANIASTIIEIKGVSCVGHVAFTGARKIILHYCNICGPVSVFSIATGYGLDGPGIKSRWEQGFPHLFRPTLGPTQPPVQ
jgi:hypothetical protein